MNQPQPLEGKDFSIILGGPFFQLLKRFKLTGNALELVKKRIAIILLVAWLPLFALCVLNGQAWGVSLSLPFINDLDIHVRFLVAMPLLIIAELAVHQRMMLMVDQFRERNLIPETGVKQFREAIASALRLRNSVVAEATMIVIIYVIGYQLVWNQTSSVDTSTWHSDAQGNLSLAGIWFRYFSLPIFQFLLLRWYYRIFIWARFLFHVSRINLNLVPTHPDDVGGLGFLSNSVYAFMPLALAHGVMVAGMIANKIFYQADNLLDFKFEILTIVFLVLCMVILPLFSFTSQLSDVKRTGSLEYGKLASRFVREFDARWMREKGPLDYSLMGSDIQSLSDLSNSYNVVESMKVLPIDRNSIIALAIITIAPVLPLVLTMMPLSELIKMLAGVLM